MKPTTAVIFAAGSGTRMLPITAAIQKELLPILNRPVIDYIVTDLVQAGVKRIIFVTRPGQTGLRDYYVGNTDYEALLSSLGKTAAIEQLQAIHQQAEFEFIEQPAEGGYGTAAALRTALPLLHDNEPIIVCGGDDFIWHADGTCETAAFIETFMASGAAGALMSLELPEDQLSHYGVLGTETKGDLTYLTDIVEKPSAGQAPSRLVNLSKYILSYEQCQAVQATAPRPEVGESYITDTIISTLNEHPVVVHRATGQFLDTGSPKNWLKANNIVANEAN